MNHITLILLVVVIITAFCAYRVFDKARTDALLPKISDATKLLMASTLQSAANQVAADNLAKAQSTTDPKLQKKLLILAKSAANKSTNAAKITGNLAVKVAKKINPFEAKGKGGNVSVIKNITKGAVTDAKNAKKQAASITVKENPAAAAGNIAALINANNGAIEQTTSALNVASSIPPATLSSFGGISDTVEKGQAVVGKIQDIANDPLVQKAMKAAEAAKAAKKAYDLAKKWSKLKNPRAMLMNMILSAPPVKKLWMSIIKPPSVRDFIAENPNLLISAVAMLMAPMTIPVTLPNLLIQVAIAIVLFMIQRHLKEIKEGLVKVGKAVGKGLKIAGKAIGKGFKKIGGGLKKAGRGAKKFFKKF